MFVTSSGEPFASHTSNETSFLGTEPSATASSAFFWTCVTFAGNGESSRFPGSTAHTPPHSLWAFSSRSSSVAETSLSEIHCVQPPGAAPTSTHFHSAEIGSRARSAASSSLKYARHIGFFSARASLTRSQCCATRYSRVATRRGGTVGYGRTVEEPSLETSAFFASSSSSPCRFFFDVSSSSTSSRVSLVFLSTASAGQSVSVALFLAHTTSSTCVACFAVGSNSRASSVEGSIPA
mmetsp:Transcript_5066/g.20330  ORF Transcript_5066/g.20330 Transcript_5066/m.20330 type:complete len:237 (+) Transcript_5066:334-1044(+)